MDLTSTLFLFLFLPIFTLVYIICPTKIRLPLMVVGSIVFLMMAQMTAIAWLGGIVTTSYGFAHIISYAKNKGHSGKAILWLGIGLNIILLALFKLVTSYGTFLPKDIASLTIPLFYVPHFSKTTTVWKGSKYPEFDVHARN